MSPPALAPIEPQLAELDETGTVALCRSLADYAEAGGLSHELMLRVGRYAQIRYAGELDVLVAVGRMYHAGGEPARARATLLQASKLAPADERVLDALRAVLVALGSRESVAEALVAAAEAPTSARGDAPASMRGAEAASTRDEAPASTRNDQATSPRGDQAASMRDAPPPSTSAGPLRAPTSVRSVKLAAVVDSPSSSRREPSLTPRAPLVRSALDAPPRESGAPQRPSRESIRPSRASLEPIRGPRIKLFEPDDPRRRLGPYELIGELASGGMATVFLGRLTGVGGFQRLVAVKRLLPHLAGEAEFIEMFLDEARIAASIHHPHVVPILEIGQSDAGGYYLVMEFIEGDTLATLANRAHARGVMLPRGVVTRVIIDALHGLHAAHQLKDPEGRLLGLIHRDCTPQNILVGVDGSSRITDFGVARAAARYAITRSQVIKGKVAYLSPEQATAGDIDRRSDLFSMGIVLWEVLTGRALFHGETDAVTIARLLAQPIPSIRKFSPDVSPALDEACARALARDPQKRFPTAAAMAEAIERAVRSTSGGVASPGEIGRCVEDLVGADLSAQRDAVRAWIAQQDGASSMSRTGRVAEGRVASVRPSALLELEAPAIPRAPRAPRDLDRAARSDGDRASRGSDADRTMRRGETEGLAAEAKPAPAVVSAALGEPRAEDAAPGSARRGALAALHRYRRPMLLVVLVVVLLASAIVGLRVPQ
jgi:serine/threonine protein kinase